uniref:Transglutaminase N-terminal domain-containing protein n=1 Tax=Apteryx owenii TaxID=8824 RepID=A0A8B9Q1R3_APTOW
MMDALLKVTGVDFLKSQNTRLHHTDAYDNQGLVVRRGQDFQLKLTFDRDLSATDLVNLLVSIGKWVAHPEQPWKAPEARELGSFSIIKQV